MTKKDCVEIKETIQDKFKKLGKGEIWVIKSNLATWKRSQHPPVVFAFLESLLHLGFKWTKMERD